jgi:chromosome segregation ATPase
MAIFSKQNGDGSIPRIQKLLHDQLGLSDNLADRIGGLEHKRDEAIARRRQLLTSPGQTDEQVLSRLDAEIISIEQSITGAVDARNHALEQVDILHTRLAEAQDRQLREGRSAEITAHVEAIEKALAVASKPVDALVSSLHTAGGVCPEAEAAGRLLENTITEVRTAAPYLKRILGDAARNALTPPPKKAVAPAPPRQISDDVQSGPPSYYKGPRGGMVSPIPVPGIEQIQARSSK